MKILFVSGLYAVETVDCLRKNSGSSGLQNAPNTFQWRVVEGLVENKAEFEVVSLPFLPAYPQHYKKLYTPQSEVIYKGKCIGQMLAYNNFFFCKNYSIRRRLKNFLKKWLSDNYNGKEEIWIISYTPYSAFSEAIIPFKQKYPKLKYCTIVADLIDDATDPTFKLSLPKLIQVKKEQKDVWAAYKHIDKYVLLSKQMEEKIVNAKGNSIVIEGMSTKVDNDPVPVKDSTIKSILYTGVLQEFTGILDLINAFKALVNDNYRLIICGSGPLGQTVENESNLDKRIEYKGSVSHEEALALQKKADLLVNPRKPTVSLTRYSFPSKTMEYMASGTPMVGYRLDGIPEEYYPHMYTPVDLETNSLSSLLDNILKQSPEELQQFGMAAKDFIRNNKEASRQIRKLLCFLNH